MFHDVAIRASFASGSSSCLNSAQLARPFVEQIREESSWAADAARNRIPSATPVPVPTWPRATWVCCSELSHLLLTYLLSLINQCQQTAPVSVNSDITLFLFLTFFFPPETFKFFSNIFHTLVKGSLANSVGFVFSNCNFGQETNIHTSHD